MQNKLTKTPRFSGEFFHIIGAVFSVAKEQLFNYTVSAKTT